MAARIAVINNDTAFLRLMGEVLTEGDYDAYCFKRGTGDYTAVRDLVPDAIILDIRLEHPEAGWNLLELFRLDPATAKTPIIVCSADVRALQEWGVYLQSQRCQVLPKPFDIETLLDLVTHVLGPRTAHASDAV
jgi:DNA-binding response OmpR family regulator